ncbi:zinc-binding dehydrogenase [Rhodopila sp.]|uniref:zinc-binding dehydrogenase n=1 Tax=Rhodopila sp. TaxID=2480087 RepID=UPI003D1239F1
MPSNQITAITVDQDDADRLAVRRVSLAPAALGEITVRVSAISLNRGEVRRALTITETGTTPGWDFAGVVEQTSGTPGAPKVGTRVVGILPVGAWAERVHAPLNAIAVIPEGVTDAQAASLPVAGLTALHALRKDGLLLGRKVLVDGATGGVGQIAIQLAAASGAQVYSHIRRQAQRDLVEASSTGGVVVGETLEAARGSGPFDFILDSVGGSALSAALTMLRRNGVCVTVGVTEGAPVTFDSAVFLRTSGASLHSIVLGDDIAATEPAADGLALLLRLVEHGRVKPSIGIEAPWTEIATVARQLVERAFTGKAVLHLPG